MVVISVVHTVTMTLFQNQSRKKADGGGVPPLLPPA
jgi:hypothetical protein